jgi:hypothetical protein
MELATNIDSFLFMGPMTVLLPRRREESEAISVFEISDKDTPVREVASVLLPPCRLGFAFTLNLSSDPPLNQIPPGRVPFYLSDNRVIRIGCLLTPGPSTEGIVVDFFDLLVPMSMFQRLKRCNPCGPPIVLSWMHWGPEHTRLLSTPLNDFECFVHGSRYVVFEAPDSLSVLDFSPNLAALSNAHRHSPTSKNGSDVRFVDRSEHSALECPYITLGVPFSTTLPYRITRRKLGSPVRGRNEGAMIDDEHVLLVDVSYFSCRCWRPLNSLAFLGG